MSASIVRRFEAGVTSALLIGWCWIAPAAYGAEPGEWVTLFNGRDLTGWKTNTDPQAFRVVDGAIRAQATHKTQRSHLFYIGDQESDFETFKNFDLEVEARGEPGANSGIFFHSDRATRDARLHLKNGYEVQLNSSPMEKRKTGSLYAVVDLAESPIDETQWFRLRLKVVGDRKRAEDRLMEENQRKDEFLAMLSHELRNPIAAVANAAELLRWDETPLVQEAAGIIKRQIKSLTALVNDLIDASRISTGKIHLKLERVLLNRCVSDAAESLHHAVGAKKHDLAISLPEEEIWVRGDVTRMKQIVINLLDNAVKYTEPGGRITVILERLGMDAFLKVKDSGVGILSEMRGRIFDLFIQVDRSLDRSQGGLGIGLSLVKRLVEMHGGHVDVESEGVGLGSEFIVRLPVEPGQQALVAESDESRPNIRSPMRLLVVEDNPDTARGLSMLLEKAGHTVSVCHDGTAALQRISSDAPDAVLMDIGLPGLNGYELAGRVRQRQELSSVKLIAMTGYGQEFDRARSREAGIDFHLVKPVSLETLLEVLMNIDSASTAEQAERLGKRILNLDVDEPEKVIGGHRGCSTCCDGSD